METHNERKGKHISVFRFAIMGAVATGLSALIVSFLISPVMFGNYTGLYTGLTLVGNGAVVGFLASLVFGIYYKVETKIVVKNYSNLFEKAIAGDDKTVDRIARFAILFGLKNMPLEDVHKALLKRGLNWRAKIYLNIFRILVIIIGILIGYETDRQAGKPIWEWSLN